MKIRLNETTSKSSVNNELYTNVELSEDSKILLGTDLRGTIDEYKQYLAEKDASTKYRFIFTIDPVCTNVLFNTVSEIVSEEGSDNCVVFGENGPSQVAQPYSTPIENLCNFNDNYIGGVSFNAMNRYYMLRNTSYTHPSVGPIVYHCGLDIFNNHILRSQDFTIVNKLSSGLTPSVKQKFNTIDDYVRDYKGNRAQEIIPRVSGGSIDVKTTSDSHLYLTDTAQSYKTCVRENIAEENGWIGFFNKANLEYPNYGSVSLNKVMNNNKVGEFIDFYPDRSLYTFTPKYNKYRNRYENNWDVCLTYPYKNIQNNATSRYLRIGGTRWVTVEGIKSTVTQGDLYYLQPISGTSGYTLAPLYEESEKVWFFTNVKHAFSVNSLITATFIYLKKLRGGRMVHMLWNTDHHIKVVDVGSDGYSFAIDYSEISGLIDVLGPDLDREIEIRLRRCERGKPCKYYVRLFKRIPNFTGTEVYNKTYVTDDEINKYANRDFNHTISKMAFERTIYNDNKCQLVYNDTIDVKGLKDNLGRDLSEVYLTIVKRNKGFERWYPQDGTNPDYTSDDIEFSHCFGKVTAGFDLPYYIDDYNVHKLHELRYNKNGGNVDIYEAFPALDPLLNSGVTILSIPFSPDALNNDGGYGTDEGITIDGDDYLSEEENTDNAFFGDLVEFSEYTLTERVLEDVHFRFNTAQREYFGGYEYDEESGYTGEYANIYYDNIVSDDYDNLVDNSVGFETKKKKYNKIEMPSLTRTGTVVQHYPANIYPEGYYYKAHYRIKLREWENKIQQGNHIRLRYIVTEENIGTGVSATTITLKTIGDFYIRQNDILYLYKKNETHDTLTVTVNSVDSNDFHIISFQLPNTEQLSNYVIYRKNPAMPAWAYELNDGTGRYIWKEMKKESAITSDSELYNSMFTNGTHYFHKNINFYLHRQDPTGDNGLLYGDGTVGKAVNMTMAGMSNSTPDIDYVPMEEDKEGSIC